MNKTIPALLFSIPALAAPGNQPAGASADQARKAFIQSLDAVNDGWFGKPYMGVKAVQLKGSLSISLSGAAVDKKAADLSNGMVKANSKGGNASLKVDSTYFASGDYRTQLTGDFGDLLATRRGDRGFIYSKDQNAYTARIDAPPSDAPITFLAWFRQTLNEIQQVYVNAPTFRASYAGEDGGLDHLVFDAPTRAWDPAKREQKMDDSLGFWKRGHLEVWVDKATRQPRRMAFRNDEQGIQTRMDFTYGADNKLQGVSIANASRGFDGPGWIRIGYGADGLMTSLAGELASGGKRIGFDLGLTWSKDLQPTSIATVPPVGATKKGREELETGLLVKLAGQIMDLQHAGLNLRSVALGGK
ncbi:MAG TPA: hypothetical protein VL181_00810 [Holophagaceae bacterium]|nr:hypothetical protein [Holophagaceae bacterium]